MSGSGSVVFGIFASRALAVRAARKLATAGRRAVVTRTIDRAGYAAAERAEIASAHLPPKRTIGYTCRLCRLVQAATPDVSFFRLRRQDDRCDCDGKPMGESRASW